MNTRHAPQRRQTATGDVRRQATAALASALVGMFLAGRADAAVTGTPALSSLPGADYTLYLDFAGFTYTGTWAGATPTPTPAFNDQTTVFTAAQQRNLSFVWTRVAAKYVGFDINVTTVDPATQALADQGLAYTDANRQAFYDRTPRFEHTVIGGNGDWYRNASASNSTAVGVSYLGAASNHASYFSGFNTNWIFSDRISGLAGVGNTAAHENGHALSLNHQSDATPYTPTATEYSSNNFASGNGSFAPVMGSFSRAQRATFRRGYSSPIGFATAFQDDVAAINALPGMRPVDDGVSHDPATPTPIVLNGSAVDPATSGGYIKPVNDDHPSAMGVDSYTKDYFAFGTDGNALTLTLNDGTDYLTPGVAELGTPFEGVLKILSLDGSLVATGTLSADTLTDTISGTLPAGAYLAEISSIGGYQSTYDATAQYYTMGSYFLTGTGLTSVLEPTGIAAMGVAAVLVRRRRRQPSASSYCSSTDRNAARQRFFAW